ncbi:MAG: 1,4-alpha-glucan branching enzyme [Dehalococcoidia bacterium]|nr:1,4-alpha-glucan branching protein GlgB [Dehalococcoidia bacterium]PWB48409.1 MAG: 1,4-alpha-glucan branching enzyme [Dehalococcoidia bacterium]
MPAKRKPAESRSLLSPDDLYLFNEGTHTRLYQHLGAHVTEQRGEAGVAFAVWAPNARSVSVVGDFNDWDGAASPLANLESSGIWEGFVPGAAEGHRYKFAIKSNLGGESLRADPFAFRSEDAPATASIVHELAYEWGDSDWMANRAAHNRHDGPISIYEMHIGSWMRSPDEDSRPLTYRELAPKLARYLVDHGFTHVEFLPVMEHPFYGSWGYQTTGYFAVTGRFGTPQDFMYLVDVLHQHGIGVILDWVPSHFPSDEFALANFDGSHLFEHADPRRGYHPDWGSLIFNYGRHEVRSFLLSSGLFWLEVFHADGLRVDAVASMLYLDYSRKAGEWLPNVYGGREDLDAIGFLRQLNEAAYAFDPGIQMFAEESTSWPGVSRPTYMGGLGFGFKWDMGWMHDTLKYMAQDPVNRKYHHNLITFRALYGFTENFVLALSHDEVVHGKGSLLGKMPGDDWQKFANLRALLAYMWCLPGKKLLFMGTEFGQWGEWNHESSLDWHLTEFERHNGLQRLTGDLNALYRGTPALHKTDCDPAGFEWIDCNDGDQSTLSFVRRTADNRQVLAVVCNFTPVPRPNFRIGVPIPGHWREILNTDAPIYGGSGQGNLGGIDTVPIPSHNEPQSLLVTLPPLAVVVFEAGIQSA